MGGGIVRDAVERVLPLMLCLGLLLGFELIDLRLKGVDPGRQVGLGGRGSGGEERRRKRRGNEDR
jgi:hypothetical protein